MLDDYLVRAREILRGEPAAPADPEALDAGDAEQAKALMTAVDQMGGGMRKAYRKATASTEEEEEITRWSQVSPFAPRETRRYVKRIKGLMAKQ